MAHKQILIVTSLVLTWAMVHEGRWQNCGCGVGYGPPNYGVPTSYSREVTTIRVHRRPGAAEFPLVEGGGITP